MWVRLGYPQRALNPKRKVVRWAEAGSRRQVVKPAKRRQPAGSLSAMTRGCRLGITNQRFFLDFHRKIHNVEGAIRRRMVASPDNGGNNEEDKNNTDGDTNNDGNNLFAHRFGILLVGGRLCSSPTFACAAAQ